MIDADGFRSNVGIVLVNHEDQLFWAKRIGQKNAWQFPQGGINPEESIETALYRELTEEIGLNRDDVEILGSTEEWLHYLLPKRYIRYHSKPVCIGQKQKWFLLRLLADESKLRLDQTPNPEFDLYKWVEYWHPLKDVVSFKRKVYRQVLEEFKILLDSQRQKDLSC